MKPTPFSLILCLLFLALQPLHATPIGWEADFGDELTDLTGEDDEEDTVTLSFPFPYAGTTYTAVEVGTNGGIQLGDLGNDGHISYDAWESLKQFYADGGFPTLFAFNSDIDLGTTGTQTLGVAGRQCGAQ